MAGLYLEKFFVVELEFAGVIGYRDCWREKRHFRMSCVAGKTVNKQGERENCDESLRKLK